MEHLYAQFEGNIWIDLTRVVACCREDFLYGRACHVKEGIGIPFGDIGQVRSVLVSVEPDSRVFHAAVEAGGKTWKAVQVVADKDGVLAELIRGAGKTIL